MYPLHMTLPLPTLGYALATDEAEHIALTTQGYQPAFVPSPETVWDAEQE